MEFTRKDLPKSQVELTVTVSPEEMEAHISEAITSISKNIEIKGFRKGKAPRKVVEQKVGAAHVLEEAANVALMKTYADIVKKEDIPAIGNPQVEVVKLAPGNPFEYKATASVLPEVKLPKLDSIKVKKDAVKVEDKEINESLESLQNSRAVEKTTDKAAKKGDKVVVSFKTYLGKVAVENGSAHDYPLIIGDSNFIPGFEDELVGLKAKDKKEFELKFPKDYHQKNLADKDVKFKVEVAQVFERELPKLDDAFAQSMGDFKKLDDLKKKLKENLTEQKEKQANDKVEDDMLKELAKKTKIEMPEVLVEQEKGRLFDEFKMMIEGQGGSFDDYMEGSGKTQETMMEEFTPRAEERVAIGLILRQLADQEKIEATDKEVEEKQGEEAMQYQYNPEIVERIHSEEYADHLRAIIRNRKAIDYLREKLIS